MLTVKFTVDTKQLSDMTDALDCGNVSYFNFLNQLREELKHNVDKHCTYIEPS